MTLDEFLTQLAARDPEVESASRLEERPTHGGQGRVLIGLGSGFPKGASAGRVEFVKRAQDASLCEYTAEHAAELSMLEPLAGMRGESPERLLESLVFSVHNASPDSLVAALLILATLADVADARQRLRPWVAAATRWDLGHMPPDPLANWPALASGLSHARFPLQPSSVRQGSDRGALSSDYTLAWQRSFRFLVESVLAGHDPQAMPTELSGPGQLAVSAMRRQKQMYEEILTHATRLQLAVPLRDAGTRRISVDTLIYVEDEPSDAVKIFGRGDPQAPGGRGYKLALSFRPGAEPNNHATIHADPTEGLDLVGLWQALESRETEKWIDHASGLIFRSADARVPSAQHYLDGVYEHKGSWAQGREAPASFRAEMLDHLADKNHRCRPLAGVNNIWRNPWYITADRSLIGSPGKATNDDGTTFVLAEGTRLTDQQILNALWSEFNPLGSIAAHALVRGLDGRPVPIPCEQLLHAPCLEFPKPTFGEHLLGARDLDERAKLKTSPRALQFRYIDWPGSSHDVMHSRGLRLTDFHVQILAALAERREQRDIELADLPPYQACRFITLAGGFAVLSQRGCIVIDDWQDLPLSTEDIVAALEKAAHWDAALDHHLDMLARCNAKVASLVRGGIQANDAYTLIGNIALLRSHFTEQRVAAAPATIGDPNARHLCEEIFDFWGLGARGEFVSRGYEQLETSAKTLLDAKSARLLRNIGIYGFAAFVAPSISKPLAYVSNDLWIHYMGMMMVADRQERYEAWMIGGEGEPT